VDGRDPISADPDVVAQVRAATGGVGVDVALEMSGFNSALNTAISAVRRGGDVIMFGIRDGDMVLRDFSRLVMNGLALHSVVGRQIFDTWHITKSLLEDRNNGIQDAIWDVILNRGEGTVVDIQDWEPGAFERTITEHTKPVLRFGGDPLPFD
jgi:threonine 3-dehydrogenase